MADSPITSAPGTSGLSVIAWLRSNQLMPYTEEDWPPGGMVQFSSSAGPSITVIKAGDVEAAGGVGGWQQSERMLREDADWWRGVPKQTMTIPVLIDRRIPNTVLTVEARLQTLRRMGRRPQGGDRPPAVTVVGDIPQHLRRVVWKIDEVRIGAYDMSRDDPKLMRRLAATVEMSSLSDVEEVEGVKLRRTREKGKRRQRVYHTKQGDTLRSIAVRLLGASNQWPDLKAWNKNLKTVRDPDAPLRRGTRLVLK